jgi:hypothetical protein
MTSTGVIHSVAADGSVYLPWQSGSSLSYYLTAAYLLMAVWVAVLGKTLPPEPAEQGKTLNVRRLKKQPR